MTWTCRSPMTSCTPSHTLVNTNVKMNSTISDSYMDTTYYLSLIDTMQYLTFTRPYISYATEQIFLHACVMTILFHGLISDNSFSPV